MFRWRSRSQMWRRPSQQNERGLRQEPLNWHRRPGGCRGGRPRPPLRAILGRPPCLSRGHRETLPLQY
jgi:hypothetical protein